LISATVAQRPELASSNARSNCDTRLSNVMLLAPKSEFNASFRHREHERGP
jgi:hypothetical protein